MRESRVKIIVATHKKYRMPSDPMYLPLHVGAEGKKDADGNDLNLGYIKDNTGDNISTLNASFCELTGLYWAWKNLNADYIGLVHYRRHFSFSKTKEPFDGVLTYNQLEPYLNTIRVFVPNKRRYFIETLYSHYAHTHYASQLDITREIIKGKYPQYLDSYGKVVKQRWGYMFNMMIMENGLLDEYCDWLFDILFELQKRVDTTGLSSFQGRFFGRVSEIIFNIWLDYQVNEGKINRDEILEIPCVHMEKVNWLKKGAAFMKAKLFNVKYEDSNFSKPYIRGGGGNS
ncbi:MAG: DUF4422 domain-containing protein [Oscillospiraceae bacterium]|nr:DUF4422 domain-containing protein [Oscillospiraceae bacterium]